VAFLQLLHPLSLLNWTKLSGLPALICRRSEPLLPLLLRLS
jgi:hypothetical protein